MQDILGAYIVYWRENHGIINALVEHILVNKYGLVGAPLDSKSIKIADVVAISIVVLVKQVIWLLGAFGRSFAVGIWCGRAWNAIFRHWKGSLLGRR